MKKRYLIPLVFLALLLLAGGAVILYLDSIAKAALEYGGEAMMGVPTTVDGVSLRPVAGSVRVDGLTVGNPDGFETPHFMAIKTSAGTFSLGNLFDEAVEIPLVTIEGVDVYLEKNQRGANYEVILENMKRAEERGPDEREAQGKEFLIREIVIRDIIARADVTLAGEKLTRVDVEIAEIRLENVGSESDGGMVESQVMGVIVKATLAAIVKQGYRILPGTIVNGVGIGLKGLGGLGKTTVKVVGDVGEGAVKVVGGVAEGVGKGVEGVAEGIGGLFGGGKKETK